MKRNIALIGLLAVYGTALFVLLTLTRMPVERLVAARAAAASGGRVALHVEDVDLFFPDGAVLKGVRFRTAGGKARLQGRLDAMRVRPDYSGLLRGYLPVRFQGTTSGGTIGGRVGWSPGSGFRDGYVRIRTEGFDLGRFPAIGDVLDRDLRGRMSAELDLRGNLKQPSGAEGTGDLRIENGALEADLGLPGLEEIPFESLAVSFTLEKGILDLTRAEMTGPAFSGRFQGDITLRDALPRSRLRLQGELTPGRMVLEDAFLSRFLQKVLQGEQSVRVRVRGTLQNPSIARIKE